MKAKITMFMISCAYSDGKQGVINANTPANYVAVVETDSNVNRLTTYKCFQMRLKDAVEAIQTNLAREAKSSNKLLSKVSVAMGNFVFNKGTLTGDGTTAFDLVTRLSDKKLTVIAAISINGTRSGFYVANNGGKITKIAASQLCKLAQRMSAEDRSNFKLVEAKGGAHGAETLTIALKNLDTMPIDTVVAGGSVEKSKGALAGFTEMQKTTLKKINSMSHGHVPKFLINKGLSPVQMNVAYTAYRAKLPVDTLIKPGMCDKEVFDAHSALKLGFRYDVLSITLK